jgi:hypothetical protein
MKGFCRPFGAGLGCGVPLTHGWERVKKFKLSGDDAPVRCHSERSEESRSVFLPLRTELRARFLASLGMTAPVDFFTPSGAVG